ncbi:ABC transporter permease [Sinomicrobium weinanense]|uniref:ABC transporter permease n=1 Tax=Sinomicrobium weinanense TaxID=2842200 RepID=A0A926Q1F5_9FLAO|nr:ABC transporter permease [Sinomicrobium weinanense]MBC9794754.1 ABC transporter permease [Sinomicrobium weinanense]MBU3125013.1 ABC transporter permease [Sinomicrobium weinanense]
MIKNYFKIAFRNLIRHKSFSALNIAGLAVGMASSILILLWVQHEKSYDRFHAHADEIYRITCEATEEFKAAVNPAGMSPALKSKISTIRNAVRFSHPSTNVMEYGDKKFEENQGFYADPTLLEVFSFPLVKGDRTTAMQRPDAILITEDMAKKYFGHTDPIGKTLKKNDNDLVTVTGVLKNIPANSHLQFDYIMPISAIASTNSDFTTNAWGNFNYYAYIQFDKTFNPTKTNLAALEMQMDDLFKLHNTALKATFHLQPLTSIHLHSNLQIELPGNGNIQYVNILFVVAIFILAVACINFMNLSTARSARRAREVGMRKVIGAGRGHLIGQFLGESILISLIALLIAIALVWLTLPAFNYLSGKALEISIFDIKMLLTLIGIALVTGLISGSYPALFLSGFKPLSVLKGGTKLGGNGNLVFRNTLVVLQFVVSIGLLVGTVVVYNQLHYIRNMNLGFEKSNLIYVPMRGDIWDKQDVYKNELTRNGLTADFTVTDYLPTNIVTGDVNIQWEGKDPNSQLIVPNMAVSERFFDVFQMKMASGRAFSSDFKGDSTNYVINEKLAKIMGLNAATAVGKSISYWDRSGTIIGVVEDFNFKPVQQAIEPMILRFNDWGGTVVVRSQPGSTEATIKALKEINTRLNPGYPFSYGFLDQNLDNLYKSEQRLGSLFNLFAALAIFISCLGLYGLSAFMAEQRFKEIGVRKVLGASVFNVVYLLSRSFIKLILIAIVIAIPIAWYAMDSWLNGFAYRVDAGWLVFVLASVVATAIALLTVSYESIKAAVANPVKSLRTE